MYPIALLLALGFPLFGMMVLHKQFAEECEQLGGKYYTEGPYKPYPFQQPTCVVEEQEIVSK